MRLVELIKIHPFLDPRYKRGAQETKVSLWGGGGTRGRLGMKSYDGVWGFFIFSPPAHGVKKYEGPKCVWGGGALNVAILLDA